MEGSRAEQQQQQQQAAPGSARWLGFAAWLRQQAGGPPEEAVSEASASDAEEADLPHAADHQQHGQQTHAASSSNGSSAGGRVPRIPAAAPPGAAAAAAAHGQLARHATTLAPRLPDCRAETRLTSDSSSRARQEMTVMLAAPGMPLHQAPLLTAKQASALMAAICEPLLSLPVGRLTRKLSAPTKLQPTEDRGVLSLWLLPDDSLSLVWQSAQQLGSEAVEEAVSSAAALSGASSTSSLACLAGHSSSSSCPAGDVSASGGSGGDSSSSRHSSMHSSGSGATQLPPLQQSCSVAMWEELAHFPAQAHLLDDAPVVTIHMLRGDASGRSFYIRVRSDVAEANLEAATAAVPDASRMLQQQRAAAATGAAPGALPEAADEPPAGAPRMYFWLADRDIGKAVYSLGRLKSLLKRPPTLSKRSGVPEHQLAQLGAWVQRADAAAAKQQQRATAAAAAAAQQAPPQQQLGAAAWLPEDVEQQQEQQLDRSAGHTGSGAASVPGQAAATCAAAAPASRSQGGSSGGSSARSAAPLMPLLGGPGSSGLLLGQPGSVAPTPHVQGSMAALLPSPLLTHQQQQQAAGSGSALAGSSPRSESQGQGSEPGSAALASGTSTVSATAAALYQDHRFNVVCPCTISVVVGMRVQAAGTDPALLPAVASARARAVAERQAKAAVDRSGRQRIEERLAEVVIRNIRAQRNRARQARQAQRDSAVRLQQAERALALARLATGRGPGPVPPPTPAPGAAAAAELAAADATTPASPAGLVSTQPAVREGQALSESPSPVVLGGETGGCAESDVLPVASPAQPPGGPGALSSPVEHPSSPTGQRQDAAFSPAPAVPLPAPLLPGGRVTIGNLQSLLAQPQGMDPSGRGDGQGSGPAELAPAAAAATAAVGAEAGNATGVPSRVSVADLADLLGKHAKLD